MSRTLSKYSKEMKQVDKQRSLAKHLGLSYRRRTNGDGSHTWYGLMHTKAGKEWEMQVSRPGVPFKL